MAALAVLVALLALVLLGALLGPPGRQGALHALHLLHLQGALHLARLARRHGPVLRVRAGGRAVLVLSSARPIREALARHWGHWLGRPPSYLGSLVSRGGQDLTLGPPCPGWRWQRAMELRSHGGAPLDPFEVSAFHSCSTIGHLLFGDMVGAGCAAPPGAPEEELWDFSRCVVELLEVWGGWASVRVLDILPPLRVLPNPGLRRLLSLVQRRDRFVREQLRRHQECQCPPPDTVLGALQGQDPMVRGGPLSPPRLHMALVDLFIGGTETTAAALAWALAFLLHRPELQQRLRAELWQELGPHGTPQVGDSGRLPLLQATISETLRLRPPVPLALPHAACRHTRYRPRFRAAGAPWRSLLPFGRGARSCLGEGLVRAELPVFLGRILREFPEPPAPGELPRLQGGSAGTVLRCPPFHLRLVPCAPPA
ncbi:LOW QUALITY PROTEIN: steroid 21-hydroxylase-like [Aegotheles albertisi]